MESSLPLAKESVRDSKREAVRIEHVVTATRPILVYIRPELIFVVGAYPRRLDNPKFASQARRPNGARFMPEVWIGIIPFDSPEAHQAFGVRTN